MEQALHLSCDPAVLLDKAVGSSLCSEGGAHPRRFRLFLLARRLAAGPGGSLSLHFRSTRLEMLSGQFQGKPLRCKWPALNTFGECQSAFVMGENAIVR